MAYLFPVYKSKKKKNDPEADLQKACVKFMAIQYPHSFFFHVPNEGKRSPQYWNWLKSLGTKAGILDLLIIDQRKGYSGYAIEIKYGDNVLSENQEKITQEFKQRNWKTAVCWSLDDFMRVVNDYFGSKI